MTPPIRLPQNALPRIETRVETTPPAKVTLAMLCGRCVGV
jgi:hypothetical protein